MNFESAYIKSNNILNYDTGGLPASEIFNVTAGNFVELALDIFWFQRKYNTLYQQFCKTRGENIASLTHLNQVPFLPVSFFKTHTVTTFQGKAEKVFTSSGSTGMNTAKHYVHKLPLYEKSFIEGFSRQYGNPKNYAFLCLLPSYLERDGSSLVYMADHLVDLSKQTDSGFFLDHKDGLVETLIKRERKEKKSILLGVTYALLDFAEQNPMELQHTIVMETGGMKGRRKELVRFEVHGQLKKAFGLNTIHSEYGMTELLSQAYAISDGIFECPPWMKVLVRSEDDPGEIKEEGTGLLCIVDLANLHSCAFIETEDVGKVHADGRFEVLGRMDNSDIRGCSLLAL